MHIIMQNNVQVRSVVIVTEIKQTKKESFWQLIFQIQIFWGARFYHNCSSLAEIQECKQFNNE